MINPRATTLTVLLSLCAGFSLSACNRNPVSIEHKPSPLPQLASSASSLVPLWKGRAGSGERQDPLRLAPALGTDQIVVASRSGDIQSWNRQGKSQWQARLKTPISGGVALDGADVAVGSPQGLLTLLNGSTGQTRWTRALTGSVLSTPLFTPQQVIVMTNDGAVTGLNRSTGAVVWTFDTHIPSVSMRGTAGPVLSDAQTVLVASSNGRVYALDAQTGIPRWERRVALASGGGDLQKMIDTDADPVVDRDQLFVVSYQSQLLAADLAQQKVLWSRDASSLTRPTVTPELVIISQTDGVLKAFDRQSGEVRWTQEALAWRDLSNPVVLGSQLIVGDDEGYLHLLNPATGQVIGRSRSSGAVRSLQVQQQQLLVQTATGEASLWQVRS